MIYHNKCFTCKNRKEFIDAEIEEAKKFYLDYGCPWEFRCGASYAKEYLNRFDVEILPSQECRNNC